MSKWIVYVVECDPAPLGVISVSRRYNDFKWLRSRLLLEFPGIFVPPLPPSQFMGRFEDEFVEERRQDLERFLVRIEEIKPFSESVSLQMFLSRPETTLPEGKKTIDEETKPISKIMSDLQSIFPDLATQQLSDDASSHDVPRLKEFLSKVESQMKLVLASGEKLFFHLSAVHGDLSTFKTAFESLFNAEKNYPYKPCVERQDIRKQIADWNLFEFKQTEIYYAYFFRALSHEHEDILAFLELFKCREAVEAKWIKAKAKVNKWQIQEQTSGIELKEKEEQQKKRDIEEEKELLSYLTMITKIMLFNEISIVWKEKTETWRQQMLQFAQLHSDITQQLLTSWKSVKV